MTDGTPDGTSDGTSMESSSDESSGSTPEPMTRVRPGEAAGELLAQARLLGALFGEQSTVGSFGRFQVLKRLGAGGMGVVYEAYDPDLARGVALKLVNVAARDRETALAEAKALARLSHPNVVPIYDVGLERDRVYLVMELVRGKTLGEWLAGRTLREIVTVYQQAGAALAAAHDVGLVHRDFKPDNAIVGDDGRVRVVDFGLACEADDPARTTTEPRGVAGTPRFMAPESKAGTAITPAADQYSFAVALADAFELARLSPPRRIAAVIERGRAAEPADRFASMRDLLRALARDPARTWRRVAIGAVVAFLVAVAVYFRLNQPDECERGAEQLDAAWSRAARSIALDRIATLSRYGQSLRPLLERDLDAQASHWVGEYRAACLDRRRGTEASTRLDRRTVCLHRGIDALTAVGELIRNAEPDNLAELPRAVQSMPNPASCSDPDVLASEVVPPLRDLTPVRHQITHVRILVGAGRYEQALVEASTAVATARALGYGPVLAEALLLQGRALAGMPDRKAAVPILADATRVALSSRADALAVEAWARRVGELLKARESDPDRVISGVDVVEPLAQRIVSATYARAILYNNLGNAEIFRDDLDKAREYFDRARIESQGLTGEDALELASSRANVELTSGDRVRADELLAGAATDLTAGLGEDHPDTLLVRWMRGSLTIEDLPQADSFLAPVCGAYELHAALAAKTARCWTELGLVRWDLGERELALGAMKRAVEAWSKASEAAAYVTLWGGDARAAAQQFATAVAAVPPQPNEAWLARAPRTRVNLGLGRARRQMGDLRGAHEVLDRTIAELELIVHDHADTIYDRLLGRARVELAITLSAMGTSAPERIAAAKAAAAWLRRVRGNPDELKRVEALAGP
jgi:tetratricopeptide (TPR) repeat protein/predicted Ser/Thr protein kinase